MHSHLKDDPLKKQPYRMYSRKARGAVTFHPPTTCLFMPADQDSTNTTENIPLHMGSFAIFQETIGLLPCLLFGECIGINKESKEFGRESFDLLARRYHIIGESLNKEQSREFEDHTPTMQYDADIKGGKLTYTEIKALLLDQKIAVVIGTVTNNVKVDEIPCMRATNLRFTKTNIARIENARERLTFDQLALRAPFGQNTMLYGILYHRLDTIGHQVCIEFYLSINYATLQGYVDLNVIISLADMGKVKGQGESWHTHLTAITVAVD
nr:60S ribosomal protein L18-2 [Tanacetum cinerariifolium]